MCKSNKKTPNCNRFSVNFSCLQAGFFYIGPKSLAVHAFRKRSARCKSSGVSMPTVSTSVSPTLMR